MTTRSFSVTIENLSAHAAAGWPSATSFVFSSKPGCSDAWFRIEPAVLRPLQGTVAFGLSIGVAAALRRRVPDLSRIEFKLTEPAPAALSPIADAFERCTGTRIEIETTIDLPVLTPTGTVFLATGGKDTLYALKREAGRHPINGLPAVYLGGACEPGDSTEIEIVERVCRRYGLKLHAYRLLHGYTKHEALLQFPGRAAWRELVTIALARQFGHRVVTGINNDEVFRGTQPLKDPMTFFSQLHVAVETMGRALTSQIDTVPGEFEVYTSRREDPDFDPAGSCVQPGVCCDAAMCGKCRGFEVYDALLDGRPLTRSQIEFVMSASFLGDAAVVRMVEALYEMEVQACT